MSRLSGTHKLFHIAVGQPVPQVPAHRQHDHLRWEPEPGEAGPRRWNSETAGITPACPSRPSINATEPVVLIRTG